MEARTRPGRPRGLLACVALTAGAALAPVGDMAVYTGVPAA